MKKIEFKILRDLGEAAVVQISNCARLVSKASVVYQLAQQREKSEAGTEAAESKG